MSTHLKALIDDLRRAGGDDVAVSEAVAASEARLRGEAAYRAGLQDEIRAMLGQTCSTHTLTEAGILADEGLAEGVMRRLGARLAPAPSRDASLLLALGDLLSARDHLWLDRLREQDVLSWTGALLEGTTSWDRASELASALVVLATRVAGAGVDSRLSERMPLLETWASPFLELSRTVDDVAEVLVAGEDSNAQRAAALAAVERCVGEVEGFRERKEQLGTTLRLSSGSLRMLQQLKRLRLLLMVSGEDTRVAAVAALGVDLCREVSRPRPIWHFVAQKLDLIAYLVVGYAAQKGETYVVRSASEYRAFWGKAIFGGFLVAIFASLKLHLSHEALAPVPQAMVYGANYAVCFVLIYLLGATLATKQPALTASRLADSLRAPDSEHESFPELVRAIWRSQTVSFLGNIAGAALFAVLFAVGYDALVGQPLIDADEAKYVAAKLHPWTSGTVVFAAVAGVLLSLAGFVGGYIDNAMVFHRMGERVASGRGVFSLLGQRRREQLAGQIEKRTGAVVGNILLGFLLGSAGQLGEILGLPLDIRHIAFASSHSALAVMHGPEVAQLMPIVTLVVAVSVIGLTNFIVSFGLTAWVAVNARQLEGVDWRAQRAALWQLVRAAPWSFVLPPLRREVGRAVDPTDGGRRS